MPVSFLETGILRKLKTDTNLRRGESEVFNVGADWEGGIEFFAYVFTGRELGEIAVILDPRGLVLRNLLIHVYLLSCGFAA
jgi:hypothetical protein